MRYKPNKVESFKADSHNVKQCCKKLFINWLTTDHGPKPKNYRTLLNHFEKIDDLVNESEAIKKELIEGT